MNNRTIEYKYVNKERRLSIIIENDGSEYIPLSKLPAAGYTAYTRFFALSEKVQPRFVVKQPKLNNIREKNLKAAISRFNSEYIREHEVWNSVYLDQQAELITEGEIIRLVLPYLPGEIARIESNDDQLTICKKVLAVIRAVQEFHQLGWSHNDCSTDNFLIEKKPKGCFKAYLIDFGNVSRIDNFRSNSEWLVISGLASHVPSLRDLGCRGVNSGNADLVAAHLLREIDRLEKLEQPQENQDVSYKACK